MGNVISNAFSLMQLFSCLIAVVVLCLGLSSGDGGLSALFLYCFGRNIFYASINNPALAMQWSSMFFV